MAKSYSEIKHSAYTVGNIMDWTNALTRLSGVPVDITEVYDSFDAAVIYAAENAVAYEGQVITVTEGGDTTVYVITPRAQGTHVIGEGDDAVTYTVYIKKVGTVPTGDDKSIDVDENGRITLHGFQAAADATLPQKKADGTIEWVTIDAIVKGDGNTKAEVTSTDGSITVTKTHNEETDTYTYDISVAVIDAYSKTQADEKFLAKADAYDDSALTGRVSTLETASEDHETRIGKVEDFFKTAEGETLDQALDTLIEIQKYIDEDGQVAEKVLANEAAIEKLNGDVTVEGSVDKKIADATADFVTSQQLTDHSNTMDTKLNDYLKESDAESTYATKSDVYTKEEVDELIGEPGKPAVKDEEGNITTEAVPGSGVYQHVYSKDEVTSLIADITGGESAADVLAALNAYTTTNDARVKAVEDKNASQDTAIGTAQDTAAQGVADAKTANEAIAALTSGVIKTNTDDISAIKGRLESLETSKGDHETRLGTAEGKITSLESASTTQSGKIGTIEGQITALTSEDARLAGLIGTNASDIGTLRTDLSTLTGNVYTKTEVDGLLENLDQSELEEGIRTNKEAIEALEPRVKTAEDAISALVGSDANMTIREIAASEINTLIGAVDSEDTIADIKSLIEYVNENGASTTALTSSVEALTGKVDTGDKNVSAYVADAIAANKLLASEEVTISDDNKLGIGTINIDKITQTAGTRVVLHGGSATA